jgi:hypothetical protein
MEKTWRSIFSASNFIIAKGAPIFLVIFAATAQVLAWIGAITLSTTQQVTIWLVVAGLLVLFSIADMACRAYKTGKRYEASAAWPPDELTSQSAARPPDEPSQTSQPVAAAPIPPDDPRPLRSVPSEEGNPGDGARLAVSMGDVFPHGCYVMQGSIRYVEDGDESVETSVVVDRLTGKRVFSCPVMDMDPEAEGQWRETEVKVVADRMPDLPPPANGLPFAAIEFEGLTAAPPTISRGRATYPSLRATGIRPITPAPAQDPEQETG